MCYIFPACLSEYLIKQKVKFGHHAKGFIIANVVSHILNQWEIGVQGMESESEPSGTGL